MKKSFFADKTPLCKRAAATLIAFAAVVSAVLCGCSDNDSISNVKEPQRISTGDEIYPAKNKDAIEKSENVYKCRFNCNLQDFTQRYNEIYSNLGGSDFLDYNKWVKQDESDTDANGVLLDYYYYNNDKSNFTATVESVSGKLMNVGCATTAENFVSDSMGSSNSDLILRKSAVMAQAVCKFPDGSTDVLQDIFYRTTFESVESLYYQGFVFSMSTGLSGKSDSSLMLLKVFPIDDSLKNEWKIADYEQYVQTATQQETISSQ